MINPLYLLGPPILLLISLPLAFFAILTTTLAFTTLLARVSIVYFELGLALLHSALFVSTTTTTTTTTTKPTQSHWTTTNPPPAGSTSTPPTPPPKPSKSAGKTPHKSPSRSRSHHRRRRSSATSTDPTTAMSTSMILPPTHPLGGSGPASSLSGHVPRKSPSLASLLAPSAAGPDADTAVRDFEGVGGWRDAGSPFDDAVWLGMNARLELPAAVPERQLRGDRSRDASRKRHHQRAHTAGSGAGGAAGGKGRWSWSPEGGRVGGSAVNVNMAGMRMSPVAGRERERERGARTPGAGTTPAAAAGETGDGEGEGGSPDEYFSMQMYRRLGASVDVLPLRGGGQEGERRRSEAGSSVSTDTCSTSSSGGRVRSGNKSLGSGHV
ncbi:hypothetical protein K490DRAFT_63829 [Saccharata proteae CBS 121410]|uniref:Uncharacterized protein n=1 Tax=Saccharata proteae CBS 121410 TaxID=1314787 RepID=A0A6A5YFV1_9PEZI|nr:hypothetical protein K490DRAFT_63829 [Saccharata proteae CBS 121410]